MRFISAAVWGIRKGSTLSKVSCSQWADDCSVLWKDGSFWKRLRVAL